MSIRLRSTAIKTAVKENLSGEVMQDAPLIAAEEGGAAAASLSIADVEMKQPENIKPKLSLCSIISYKLFLAGFLLSAAAIAWDPSELNDVAFGFSMFVTVYAAYQRRKLDYLETLRQVVNRIRQEVNHFMIENDNLTRENNRLEIQANKVTNIESNLRDILIKQSVNVDSFVESVKEHQVILDEMKENIKASVAQNLMTAVMRADRDEDYIIDPEEVQALLLRLRAFDGIDVDERKFRYMLEKKGRTIHAVVDLIKDLMDDSQAEEDSVFVVRARNMTRGSIGMS